MTDAGTRDGAAAGAGRGAGAFGTFAGKGFAAIESMRTISTWAASPVFLNTARDVSALSDLLSEHAPTVTIASDTTANRIVVITAR